MYEVTSALTSLILNFSIVSEFDKKNEQSAAVA